MDHRYEILPFGAGVEEACSLPAPATITVTCSPRHGVDLTVDVAARLREHGHRSVVHLAARMVHDRDHLDALLERMAQAGIDDVFLVGGDASEPHGPFDSGLALLPLLHDHPLRPRAIGIGAYPEGHALIDDERLQEALARKSELADYVVTQLCFDPEVLLAWIAEARADGLRLPIYPGVPGAVERRRLLEVSLRVGVGPSVSFLRKQRGLRRLLGGPSHAARLLYDALAPHLDGGDLGLAGLHWYTFNRLCDTIAWEADRASQPARREAAE